MNIYRLESKLDARRMVANVVVLGRFPLSFVVAVVSMLGYFLHTPDVTCGAFAAGLGSFFLCAGCSALNQVQEKRTDGYFSRTVLRPLPQGYLSARMAALMGGVWIGLAASLYAMTGSVQTLALGAGVVVVYNGMYTALKRRSSIALLVGCVAGALPPLMGWVAAGGSITDPLILTNCTIWYFAQIAHGWVQIYTHKEEYLSRFSPLVVSYFVLMHHKVLMRVWYFAYICSIMSFALVCTWTLGVSSLVGAFLGGILLLGSVLPLTRLTSLRLFDIASMCILLGAVLVQL
ncbi:UbiA family prenyltransferase [Halodesulfovibrio sp.]|jgi:protoheme IX farnesyltransferase|uniref:UbiA family prenyltransferase n=1 Tax=Halodesulfovibrio sp. TaxID=1912772 RepID=UPI0025ECB501|nr:UbiA family prenyltransferase [Halodesulfovibrio sp.]MCT4533916.1 UbiA family prenyltransferase [Halodesulfovibrio sp.]